VVRHHAGHDGAGHQQRLQQVVQLEVVQGVLAQEGDGACEQEYASG
jgi:hypothetical protein